MTVRFFYPKTTLFQALLSLLYYLYCLCNSIKDRYLIAFAFLESGCKGKNFIPLLPNVFESFFFESLKAKTKPEHFRTGTHKQVSLSYTIAECQAISFPSLGKRVQKYALLQYNPNYTYYFFKKNTMNNHKTLKMKTIQIKLFLNSITTNKNNTLLYIYTQKQSK